MNRHNAGLLTEGSGTLNSSSPTRTVVRLFNDGPMTWPLWFLSEVADDRGRQPISDELAAELLDWTDFSHQHYDDNWDSDENATHYNTVGQRLGERVSIELGPQFQVFIRRAPTASAVGEWVEIA